MSSTQCRYRGGADRLPAAWPSLHNMIRARVNRGAGRALALALLLALSSSAKMVAQAGTPAPRWGVPSPKPNDTSELLNEATGTEDQRLLQMRNAARHLDMVSDAGKLLRVANELHTELVASNTSTLTPAQVRKLRKIEKLAHKVRAEMAVAVGYSQGGIMPIGSLGGP